MLAIVYNSFQTPLAGAGLGWTKNVRSSWLLAQPQDWEGKSLRIRMDRKVAWGTKGPEVNPSQIDSEMWACTRRHEQDSEGKGQLCWPLGQPKVQSGRNMWANVYKACFPQRLLKEWAIIKALLGYLTRKWWVWCSSYYWRVYKLVVSIDL